MSKCESNTHTPFGIVEGTDFITVVSVGVNNNNNNKTTDTSQTADLSTTNTFKPLNNSHTNSDYVTVLTIGDTNPNDSSNNAFREQIDEVLVYRLPGERLGFGLKFEGGTKASEFVRRLYIQSCSADSPASRAESRWGCLIEGDEVLEIDKVPVKRMTRIDCVRCLKDSNMVITLLVRHVESGDELDSSMRQSQVIDSIEKKRAPPPVPPRKVPRKLIKPPEPDSAAKSATSYKTSTQTEFKFRGLADGGVIPPDAQVYLDLFSHQESLYSLSESDDTGSSISTVVDRLSSFPTTSASSLAGSLPSTPTAVQRRLDIGAMFDCDREMTALQHENNSDLFAKLATLQAKRAADCNEQQVQVSKGKVQQGSKAAMKTFEALQPPANFQDAPLSYGTEDVRTVETPIKSAILESANPPPKECNNNDITSLALTAPRFSLRSSNTSEDTEGGSAAVSGDGLPRLVDFVPKHSRVLVVSANDAASDNVVVVPVEDDAMDSPHSAYFYEKRDDGTDECYSDDELDHSDYSDENDSGGGITVLGAFDKWNEMYGVSWKGATQLETIGEVEETPAAVNNVEGPSSKNSVEESQLELKTTTVHTKQPLKTTEIQLEITKDVLPNDVMSHSPPIYSRQPPDGHEFPDYVETPLSLPTPDHSPPAAITPVVVLSQSPPAVPSNPPPVIPSSKPPPTLPSKPPPSLPSKPPPSIPSSKPPPPPIVTSRLPPAVPTSTPPTTPPPPPATKPPTNSTQFREKIAMFSSHEEPITLRQASKLSNNCRSSLDISLLQPPSGKSSSGFDSAVNDSAAVTTSEEPFNRPLSSRLHTRSQSLVDISSSGGTSSADRWSQLVEQRKRGMSKLKGLVIPEHSSTFAEISPVSDDTPTAAAAAVPVVVDLPEIRSATTTSGTNLPALTIVSTTTTTTAPSHYNNSRVARSPLHLPEPIWKTEQTSGASLAKYSPAFKRKRLQVLDAANASKTPPSGYDLKSTATDLHATKTPPKSLESITSPSQSDCSSFEYNANCAKNTAEKLDDSDNDSAVSSSESRDSCSSPSGNNNEIADESGRLLDPTSVEAINRKNILASAKCRSGKDFKVGSPQLIQRKLSNGELETDGERIDETVDETVEKRRELVLEDAVVDLNCPKVIVNETTTVELLINNGDLKAIEESLPEEVASSKTNSEVVETETIPSEVNSYTIEPEMINNTNSCETNLTKETNDLLGKIESVVNIKSTKEIRSLGKEVSSTIRTTSVRKISSSSTPDNPFDSQTVVKTLERQTSTGKNDRKLSTSSLSERLSLESDLVPMQQSTVTHTESSVVTTPRLQSTVIVTESTIMTTPTLRSTVSVTESSVTTSSKSLCSAAAIPESNLSTVKLRETKVSTSNASNTRSVQLRPVSSPIDRKQSTVLTNKQQHRFSGSNIPLTKGSNKGKTAASSVNDLRKMFQQTSVTSKDNGDVKIPGGNCMTDKSDKAEKRLPTSAAAKFSRLPQAVAPVEGSKVGKSSSVQHKLGKDEHEALLSRVLAEIGEPLDRKQCKIVILKPELPGGSLGVTLAGGLDYETKEITVHSIRTGSIAFQEGQLQRGDRILSINDRNFKLLTHQQSAAVLKEPVSEFIIVVCQGKGPKTPIAAASPKRASLFFDLPSPTSKEAKPLSKSTLPTTTATAAITAASIISDCIEVKLVKDSTSIGFSIAGGFDSPTGDLPVVIKKLFTGGAAEKSGLLRVDDELVAINDVVVTTMTRIDVWNMMKKLPEGLVTLKIRR